HLSAQDVQCAAEFSAHQNFSIRLHGQAVHDIARSWIKGEIKVSIPVKATHVRPRVPPEPGEASTHQNLPVRLQGKRLDWSVRLRIEIGISEAEEIRLRKAEPSAHQNAPLRLHGQAGYIRSARRHWTTNLRREALIQTSVRVQPARQADVFLIESSESAAHQNLSIGLHSQRGNPTICRGGECR